MVNHKCPDGTTTSGWPILIFKTQQVLPWFSYLNLYVNSDLMAMQFFEKSKW